MADCYPTGSPNCATQPTYSYAHTNEPIVGNVPFIFDAVEDERSLVVSNSPETIQVTTQAQTLYNCNLPSANRNLVRVWLWHLNSGAATANISIRLFSELASQVSDHRHYTIHGNPGDILTAGMCVAERQLTKNFPGTPGSTYVPPAQETSIWSHSIPGASGNAGLVGSIHEFSVGGSGPLGVRIAIASASGAWGNPSDEPPIITDGHIRGWWPFCRVRFKPQNATAFNCSTIGGHPPRQYGVCETNGGEHAKFAHQGLDPEGNELDEHGTTNIGCYGADLSYRIPCETGPQSAGNLYVALRARNNAHYVGGPPWAKYAGSGHIILPNAVIYDIPKYPCDQDIGTSKNENAFDLCQSIGQPYIWLGVSQSYDLNVLIANAGAAALPTNILLSHELLLIAPVQGGGE